MVPFTLISEGRTTTVGAVVDGSTVRLPPPALREALGWKLEPEGLCRDGICLPVRAHAGLVTDAGVDLRLLARLLDLPLALDLDARAAALGDSAVEQSRRLASLEAPDVELPALDGTLHRLSEFRGRKVLLVAWASWCGCRQDLPVWQERYEALKDEGLTVVTVALDQSPEAARPFIERAQPTHPSLVDTEHRVAALFGMINVPTVVWIDEEGTIVRPPAIEHGSDQFKAFHGLDHEPHLAALERWVRDGELPMAPDAVRDGQLLPTPEEQLARAEFALAWHLHRTGMADAAERHFEEAGRLAPIDWTIRRGSMPIRGQDPMGADFVPLWEEYEAAGRPGYETFARRRQTTGGREPQ